MQHDSIIRDVIKVADEASERVLHIYNSDFKVNYKEDDSPITAADIASHETIVKGLRQISHDIPVLSEEGAAVPWQERQHWRCFWLIDPLDGTKDFAQRSGEFTVNIALIEDGCPVLGVVVAPALGEAFWGVVGEGAFKRDRKGAVHRLRVAEPRTVKRVVASKNHLTERTQAFIEALGETSVVQVGSSLKLCRIAEGRADIYPRHGPTSEWDIAAAQAVLVAAGGLVLTLDGEPLKYGKESVINPEFVAANQWSN